MIRFLNTSWKTTVWQNFCWVRLSAKKTAEKILIDLKVKFLGLIFENGLGGRKDLKRARRLLKQSEGW